MENESKNPVKYRNQKMRELYKHHLCLHCSNLSYWDWYICQKRIFTVRDFTIKQLIEMWWKRFSWNFYDASIHYMVHHFFDIDQFIPNKPIKKCKFYEPSNRRVFWTKIVDSGGTTWIDDGEENEF